MEEANKQEQAPTENAEQKEQQQAGTIFDEMEEIEEKAATTTAKPEDDDDDDGYQALTADMFSDEAPADKPKRESLDGKTVTIKGVRVTQARTTDRATGNPVPPTQSQNNPAVKYYRGKLVLEFDHEGDTYIEYVPNVKFFVDANGTVAKVPRIPRAGENEVAKLFRLYAQKVNKTPEEISDRQFLEGLQGLKVTIRTKTGKFSGRDWMRNDIVKLE